MQAVEHDARIREAVLLGDEIQIPGEWQVDAALVAEFAQYGDKAAEVAATLGVFDWPYAHRENEKGQLERIISNSATCARDPPYTCGPCAGAGLQRR